MKYSQFNSIVPYNGKFGLYNSFKNNVIFLDGDLKDLLEAAVRENIDELEDLHPTFYSQLIQNEFLIENAVDEVEKVKRLSREIDENLDTFILTVNPTMNCNFKCWYCYENHIKDSRLTDEGINKINTFIRNTFLDKALKNFHVSFFGGEPLLYFNKSVIPIMDCYLAECKKRSISPSIFFTTNGYLINDEFLDYFIKKDCRCSLQITLDGYREMHDLVRFVNSKKGSYDTIIENIKKLIVLDFPVRLRINYTDKNIVGTDLIANEFENIPREKKDKFLKMDYHRVWQNNTIDNTFDIVDTNVAKIQEKGISVSSMYSPNNVKGSCYADRRNSAVINYNGDLFKCTARDFTPAKRAGYLSDEGNLIWENGSLEKRMDVKFKNKPCLSCRIMPLCNGGCSQHALEHLEAGLEYCVHSFDENEKLRIVKTKVAEIAHANS